MFKGITAPAVPLTWANADRWLTPDVNTSECRHPSSGRAEEVLQAGDLLVEEALLLEVGCC
jgi:hypothetical protein